MAIGSNLGNQLNVLVLEVVMVTRGETDDVPPGVLTVGVHPLVVGPGSIRYQDGTRSAVRQTYGASVVTKGGRSLRTVSLSGNFGVETRGLGTYTGTGAQRFARFYHEVVRLSDAVTKGQVDAERQLLRSPLLSAAIRSRYDPERCTFAVNWYDLWHEVAFEALVQSFSFEKSHRNGGAVGLTPYSMTLQEVGPLAVEGIGTAVVRNLFEALGTWSTVNETLQSYTLDSVVDALVAGANVPLAQLASSIGSFKAQIDGATGVVNGYVDTFRQVVPNETDALVSNDGSTDIAEANSALTNGSSTLVSHLGQARQIVLDGEQVLDALLIQGPARQVDSVAGALDWTLMDDATAIRGLDAVDRIEELVGVIEAARFQEAVGALYGMGRDEYAALVTGTGSSGRSPTMAATLEHTVTAFDTPSRIERRYGVAFEDVLQLNDLLPDEALVTGRVLLIPQRRSVTAPTRIDGLPVFGSHAGRAAWGRDLWADLRTDDDGRLLICEGEDVLVQGMDWMVATFRSALEDLGGAVPEVARDFVLGQRVAGILLSDKRIASVESITIQPGPDGASVQILPVVTAINGGTVGVTS